MSFLSFPNPTIIVFQIQPSIENAFNKYFLDCEHEQIKLKISSFLWGHWMSQILGAQRSDKKAWGNLNCKNSMGGSGLVAKLFPTFETPMDCSPPGSPVHGILQARILEWAAISFSRGSFRPRDWNCVSCTASRFFTTEPPGKPLKVLWRKSTLESLGDSLKSGSQRSVTKAQLQW